MANESTPDAEVNREINEAAAAGARAARTRSPEDITNALKEGGEAVAAIAKSGWSWQKIVLAIGAAVVVLFVGAGGVAMVMRDANPPAVISTPVKADPDIAKMLTDEFAKLDRSLTRGFDSLAKKIDAKPAPVPVPVDPDKPKPPTPGPKKLALPERVEVAVGSVAKIKASLSSGVQWVWRESPGLDVDKHGSTLYVQADRDGVYWVFAYVSVDGKIGDIAACMVVAGKGPQPPPGPGPGPEPKPPTPADWPTTTPGLRVLIVFEEMERHKLTAPQRAIIDGAPIRDWLDTKCVQDGAVKAWRIFDQNQGVQGAEKHWQEMMARKRASVPWCVICNYPKAYYEGPLPASVDEFKAIIQKVE